MTHVRACEWVALAMFTPSGLSAAGLKTQTDLSKAKTQRSTLTIRLAPERRPEGSSRGHLHHVTLRHRREVPSVRQERLRERSTARPRRQPVPQGLRQVRRAALRRAARPGQLRHQRRGAAVQDAHEGALPAQGAVCRGGEVRAGVATRLEHNTPIYFIVPSANRSSDGSGCAQAAGEGRGRPASGARGSGRCGRGGSGNRIGSKQQQQQQQQQRWWWWWSSGGGGGSGDGEWELVVGMCGQINGTTWKVVAR